MLKLVLPVSVPCFRTEEGHWASKDKRITTYHTKDGLYFYEEKECINLESIRLKMVMDYNGFDAKDYFRDNPRSNPFLQHCVW
jgi:hypothetical protein